MTDTTQREAIRARISNLEQAIAAYFATAESSLERVPAPITNPLTTAKVLLDTKSVHVDSLLSGAVDLIEVAEHQFETMKGQTDTYVGPQNARAVGDK